MNDYIGFKYSSKVRAICTNQILPLPWIHFNILEIICVLNGSVIVTDSFSNYHLNKGDLHIVNPTYPYRIYDLIEDGSSTLLLTQIDLEYYKRFFPEINDNMYLTCNTGKPSPLINGYLKYLRFLLAKVFLLYNDKDHNETDFEITVKSLIRFLLQHFRNYAYEKDVDDNCKITLYTGKNKSNDPDRIYRIIGYICNHYYEKIRLEDIADQEFLCPEYLSRYIKKASGISFSDHVSMVRCEKAEELLVTTNKAIDFIAEEVGFSNRQHLLREFRRWFKMTPSHFRKIYSGTEAISMEPSETVDMEQVMGILESFMN